MSNENLQGESCRLLRKRIVSGVVCFDLLWILIYKPVVRGVYSGDPLNVRSMIQTVYVN